MIYFTSDLHLGHNSILKFSNDRNFSSVDEMNKALIDNINCFVKKNDTLYLLGDIAYRIPKNEAEELISRINGKKIFIRGNHDDKYDPSLFEGIYDYLEYKQDHIRFCMMHYPLRSWHGMRHGSIQLHGHIHASKQYNLDNREKGIYQYDVGVDANDYYPVNINQIIDFFKDVPLGEVDHHYFRLMDDEEEE